uniref:Uncharacterized protein n=1 Tax=Heterorhabditis bacteriophora TaxID=37862 RepID=A0A1I7WU84_HETBA
MNSILIHSVDINANYLMTYITFCAFVNNQNQFDLLNLT